jgi:hypothetical protein
MWDLWWTEWHSGRLSLSTSIISACSHSPNFCLLIYHHRAIVPLVTGVPGGLSLIPPYELIFMLFAYYSYILLFHLVVYKCCKELSTLFSSSFGFWPHYIVLFSFRYVLISSRKLWPLFKFYSLCRDAIYSCGSFIFPSYTCPKNLGFEFLSLILYTISENVQVYILTCDMSRVSFGSLVLRLCYSL